MRITLYLVLLGWSLGVLGGCASKPVEEIKRIFRSHEGRPYVTAGIRNYDDGRYNDALVNFETAIKAGLSDTDEVTANKYLAFIACVGGRDRQCRAYFRRALEINPNFELSPPEAGHPIWGPVFRSVKSSR